MTFDPLVWRRMDLSTFMFKGEPKVEQVEDQVVIHLPTQFHNEIDIGSYPYPFWHSTRKWDSYQQTKEVLLLLEQGKLVGALRSAETDPQRPKVAKTWDGQWNWTDEHGPKPTAVLYDKLFLASNPYVAEVDQAYRAFKVDCGSILVWCATIRVMRVSRIRC